MKRITILCSLLLAILLITAGCGKTENAASNTGAETTAVSLEKRDHEISASLTYTGSLELSYAKQYAVDHYENGFELITITDGSRYLLVPEGQSAPEDLAEGIVLLQGPVKQIYLVASAVMDMFVSFDGLDRVGYSALEEGSWYIDEAKAAMKSGEIAYAGKYSAPDYEMIVAGGCSLAIENTMIYHSPKIKEELENFGIPVLVDYSSYETNPLGRCEWVKLYGLLTDHTAEADAAFEEQEKAFTAIADEESAGKTVAFFYLTANGEANVRKSSDYLAKMINMAGGEYIFSDLGDEDDTASSTMSMTMEEFYASAKNADYVIYNSNIEGELGGLSELTAKSDLLSKFKAVQEGHVYCTTKNLYQSSMELGDIIADLYYMMQDDPADMKYLYPLN